ncbi:helix-turn-helix transcriptional regulator [Leptothoe sp. EHU-05/26/07-4]
MNLKKLLCANFKNALEEQEISTSMLAKLTGWHRNLWIDRTNGTTDIKVEDLVIAAKAMRISPYWLVSRVIEQPPVDDRYALILQELQRINRILEKRSGA